MGSNSYSSWPSPSGPSADWLSIHASHPAEATSLIPHYPIPVSCRRQVKLGYASSGLMRLSLVATLLLLATCLAEAGDAARSWRAQRPADCRCGGSQKLCCLAHGGPAKSPAALGWTTCPSDRRDPAPVGRPAAILASASSAPAPEVAFRLIPTVNPPPLDLARAPS